MYDLESEDYPNRVRWLLKDSTPKQLEMQGNRELLKEKCVAFSGVRAPSLKGLHAVRDCAEQVANQKMVVVSGGARGVDFEAHYTALKHGGSTIIVLPQGIETYTLPERLKEVWDWERGLILSQFRSSASWKGFQALERNKVIVALGESTIIIESNDSGGTFHTGTYSVNRRLTYAIQYHDMSHVAKGNQLLIEAGATPVVKNKETNRANLVTLFREIAWKVRR